tara:strand:+ start:2266 stop:2670 length:405 start_codon:yes stop_codon:yes gene_type:complete
MTIFDFINDILYRKKGNLLDNIDDESSFNLYMINRWTSMYSTSVTKIINLTTNRYYSIFDTKKEMYNFLVRMLPKVNFRRIHYIKKKPKSENVDKEVIKQLAKSLELSEREISYYISTNKVDLENLRKCMVTKV